MTDIHTHILPNVDDGSNSLETSLELLKLESMEGVTIIILTPHQAKDNIKTEELKEAFTTFKEQTKNLGIDLYLGSEIYYYSGLKKDLADGKLLTMNDSKYVLIEFSTRVKENIADIIYDIAIMGFIPIVAHIERYDYLTFEDYVSIHKYAKIQVNASSFLKKNYKKILKFLIKEDLIDFVASDCHDISRRYPDFKKAKKVIKKKRKERYNEIFVKDAPFIDRA